MRALSVSGMGTSPEISKLKADGHFEQKCGHQDMSWATPLNISLTAVCYVSSTVLYGGFTCISGTVLLAHIDLKHKERNNRDQFCSPWCWIRKYCSMISAARVPGEPHLLGGDNGRPERHNYTSLGSTESLTVIKKRFNTIAEIAHPTINNFWQICLNIVWETVPGQELKVTVYFVKETPPVNWESAHSTTFTASLVK